MNTTTARQIAAEVARLTELAAVFTAKYGQEYRMKPGSPQDAWSLYDSIFEAQCAIARLLNLDALEQPYCRWGRWWDHREVIDSGILNELAGETFRLIGYCATSEALPGQPAPLTVRLAQQTIAGTLHPGARQMGMDRRESA